MIETKTNILYEDNHVIVAVKPAGVLAQAGEMDLPDMLTILKAYLKEKYQKPGNVFLGLVHRLDLNVGGVMVFAKTSKAASRLAESVREHEFSKQYLAVVQSTMTVGSSGNFSDWIAKDENAKIAIPATESSGKLAQLQYEAIETKSLEGYEWTLVTIALLTGRFHQIRYQFSHHGHPLYADVKYGSSIRKLEGLGLYAYRLSFIHPTTGADMTFTHLPDSGIFTAFDLSRFRP